jgi:hypothetical protein
MQEVVMENSETRSTATVELRAIVGRIVGQAPRGFAVTYLQPMDQHPDISCEDTVTFSLTDWEGEDGPQKEQVVILDDVQLFRKGWRARSARPIMLSNKKSGIRKEVIK